MLMRFAIRPVFGLIPALLVFFATAAPAIADPPSRVARLSFVGGEVSMRAAGLEDWTEARINRPLISGDNLYTDRASRVEMEIGAATVRLDERTSFGLLDLDDDNAQVELTAGTLNLNVQHVFEGQRYEVDTPTLALVIDEPGRFRVDIAPDGSSTMVTVVDGSADVYGSDNASFRVSSGYSYRFYDTQLEDYETLDLPRQDEFDRWCYERTERYERSPSRRYVSDEVIGYADLDDYGSWRTSSDYGAVWYPSSVAVDWAPYRDGHWSWIDPWGWTWVDNAAWGFAPSHYGRWAFVGSRWGWIPGPRHVRPVYAPALVAFVGGGGFSVTVSSGGPVGWFPLGPRDVYVPWYHGSRDYFNRVNVHNTTIINNVYITNVYNNYSRGRPIDNFDYAYRRNNRAFTAVSHDAFVNARSVNSSRVQVAQAQLARGQVVSRVQVTPTARSFFGGSAERGGGRAVRDNSFERQVIARKQPPAQRLDARTRIQAISRNDNQPLATSDIRELSARTPPASKPDERRIRVVGNDRAGASAPRALPQRSAAERNDAARKPINGRAGRGEAQRPAVENDARDRTQPTTKPSERSERMGRTATPARNAEERSDRANSPSKPAVRDESVERDRAVRGRPANTVRAPRATERDATAERPQRVQREERPEPQVRDIQQRKPERRVDTVRQVPEPQSERNVAPQRGAPRNVPEPRQYPQQREKPQQQPPPQREVQQRAPPVQQQRELQKQPPRNVPTEQPRVRDKSKKDDDKDDKDERKRRDRN